MSGGTAPGAAAGGPAGGGAARGTPAVGFGDRLAEQVRRRESQLVLGLDPDPSRLWAAALEHVTRPRRGTALPSGEGAAGLPGGPASRAARAASASPAARAAAAVTTHCRLVIDAVAEQCVAVKLQLACFERLGPPGWVTLHQTAAYARAAGLLVIADAKRGDVAVSSIAYAQAFVGETPSPFGAIAGLGADALTVSPWLGADALAPLITVARSADRPVGLFALVRTSNPGAAALQDLELADGGTVSLAVARMVDRLGADAVGRAGLSDVGAVVGATAPSWLASLREAMPHAVFLIPGVGAQGGRIEDLGPAFGADPASAIVSVSRGIVDAHRAAGGDPAACARRAAAQLRESLRRLRPVRS